MRRALCGLGNRLVEAAASAERAAQSRTMVFVLRKHGLVEAAGIEPASEEAATTVTTCVVRGEISSPCPPRTNAAETSPIVSRASASGKTLARSSQSMTPTHRPWKPNRWGRVLKLAYASYAASATLLSTLTVLPRSLTSLVALLDTQPAHPSSPSRPVRPHSQCAGIHNIARKEPPRQTAGRGSALTCSLPC